MASYYRRDAAALAPLLRPVATPEDADALFKGLGGSGPAVAAACQLVSQQRGEGFSLQALFEGVGRWALAALGPDAPPAEQPWAPGSGPQARAFTAAECRGVLANILLLNVVDPVGERDFKPPSKNGGLRLDRRMLSCDAVGTHKLACLLHYFAAGLEAEGTEDDSREVRFERRVGVAQPLPGFRSSAGHAGAEFP